MRLGGLDLYPYTFAFGPTGQHQHHQFFAVWKPADIVLIPPLVVLVVKAVVMQRLSVSAGDTSAHYSAERDNGAA